MGLLYFLRCTHNMHGSNTEDNRYGDAAFQFIVRCCWTISCERFFKACRRSQNYDVIIIIARRINEPVVLHIYIIFIYNGMYNKTRNYFSIIAVKQPRDFSLQSLKPESSSFHPLSSIPHRPASPSILSTNPVPLQLLAILRPFSFCHGLPSAAAAASTRAAAAAAAPKAAATAADQTLL